MQYFYDFLKYVVGFSLVLAVVFLILYFVSPGSVAL